MQSVSNSAAPTHSQLASAIKPEFPSAEAIYPWERLLDQVTGEVFYSNQLDGETVYELPMVLHAEGGWEKMLDDESFDPYWYSSATHETTWTNPLIAAHHGNRAPPNAAAAAALVSARGLHLQQKQLLQSARGGSLQPPMSSRGAAAKSARGGMSPANGMAANAQPAYVATVTMHDALWPWEKWEDQDEPFYENILTFETAWDVPAVLHSQDGYDKMIDEESGEPFWLCVATGVSTWFNPWLESHHGDRAPPTAEATQLKTALDRVARLEADVERLRGELSDSQAETKKMMVDVNKGAWNARSLFSVFFQVFFLKDFPVQIFSLSNHIRVFFKKTLGVCIPTGFGASRYFCSHL